MDFVDYDEVAHHAGGNRIEALEVLSPWTRSLGSPRAGGRGCAASLPLRGPLRPRTVAGSALRGACTGTSLGDVCSELASQDVVSLEENVESWGRVESVLDDLAGDESFGTAPRAGRPPRLQSHSQPARRDSAAGRPGGPRLGQPRPGLRAGRSTGSAEDIDARWPRLLPGLAAHPGHRLRRRAQPRARARRDRGRRLPSAAVRTPSSGVDPLAPYAAHARLGPAAGHGHASAPDIYVNSAVDAATLEISAFEGLVGAHGGLGGWQDQGTLIAPTDLLDPGRPRDPRGRGAPRGPGLDASCRLGQRTGLPRPVPPGADSPGGHRRRLVPHSDDDHE